MSIANSKSFLIERDVHFVNYGLMMKQDMLSGEATSTTVNPSQLHPLVQL